MAHILTIIRDTTGAVIGAREAGDVALARLWTNTPSGVVLIAPAEMVFTIKLKEVA